MISPGYITRHPSLAGTALLLLVALLLSACATTLGPNGSAIEASPEKAPAGQGNVQVAQANPPGIGGTGKQPGIGGTGQFAGTPGIGGTGIIGTVTGFGSILVNGYRVSYAPNQPVAFKDRVVRADALRVGQVVEVEANGSGNQLQARSIVIRHEVAGPIERIDHARRTAVVFGQRIDIPGGSVHHGGSARLSITDLKVGDHIDVSGLRRANGVIAASRVAKRRPGAVAVLRGRVTSSGPNGFSVNGVRVDAPPANRPAGLASGRDVKIIGTATRGRFRARRIVPEGARPFGGRVQQLSVEGYVSRAISGGVAIGRVPITQLPARARLQAGQRVILDGRVDNAGRFAPNRVRPPVVDPVKSLQDRRRINRAAPVRRQALPPPPPPRTHRPPPPRPPVYRPPPRAPRRR